MIHREKNLPIYVLLIGAVLLSIGYSFTWVINQRIDLPHVPETELKEMQAEIERLEILSKKGYKNTGE